MGEVTTYAEARRIAEDSYPYAVTGGVHASAVGYEDEADYFVPWEHDDPDSPPVVSGVRSSWIFVSKATGKARAEFPPDAFAKVDAMTLVID